MEQQIFRAIYIGGTRNDLIGLNCSIILNIDFVEFKFNYVGGSTTIKHYISGLFKIDLEVKNTFLLMNINNESFKFEVEKIYLKKIIDFYENSYHPKSLNEVDIEMIDNLSGVEFENFLIKMFYKKGFEVIRTKASYDQGVDFIILKNEEKIAVQSKNYSNKVTNSAIQEVLAGKKFYNCTSAIVITNSYFTKSAEELAKVTGVSLWNRTMLINEYQKMDERVYKDEINITTTL